MQEFDLAINNGLVINADGRQTASVGISHGKIAALSAAPLQAKRIIDAAGKWVLPGVIDTHVHYKLKQGQGEDAILSDDDYNNGPVAAAVGGVTTFIDFAIAPSCTIPHSISERAHCPGPGRQLHRFFISFRHYQY